MEASPKDVLLSLMHVFEVRDRGTAITLYLQQRIICTTGRNVAPDNMNVTLLDDHAILRAISKTAPLCSCRSAPFDPSLFRSH